VRTKTTAADASEPLRQVASRLRNNLWQLPNAGQILGASDLLLSYLAQVRREFEYSIVEGPPAGKSHEATMMAQYADGVILVLSAHRTRRVMARKIKQALEGARARILGTVLSDRVFPIPEGIYRRL
jgi:Mrp family chromosome partitioning ATPase